MIEARNEKDKSQVWLQRAGQKSPQYPPHALAHQKLFQAT